jgi:hypothetical protein
LHPAAIVLVGTVITFLVMSIVRAPRRLPRTRRGNDTQVPGTARTPDYIDLERHRDDRHLVERATRWLVVAVLAAVAVAGLANVFGQHQVVLVADSDAASLRVSAPGALRSGLIYQGRFEVDAHAPLRRPTLVLARGWWDAMSVNSVEPQPTRSRSSDGHVAMEFAPVAAGRSFTVYVYLQANPTTAGRRDQSVELRDGDRTIASIDRSVNVFP